MQEKFSDILHDWHGYLVGWTRDRAPKLIVIVVVSFILVRLLGTITRRIVALSERRGPEGAPRAQQIRTVVGVVHSFGMFLIVLLASMSALKDVFNFNIEPLLASAGIAGLALGFGAQTLVKDIINGFFILLENPFQVGDTIRTAGVSGKVEEINMRRTALRDSDGTLHVVPNSSIQIVSNLTRDWSQVALNVSVDYNENSDRVMESLRQAARDFAGDPAFQADVVADPEVPGIERVRGREIEYLVLAKVRPSRRQDAARELRRRIKACLEENNIKAGIPVPGVMETPPS